MTLEYITPGLVSAAEPKLVFVLIILVRVVFKVRGRESC